MTGVQTCALPICSWQGELVAQRKDGSSFIQALTLNLTEGGTFICIFRDITEQKQAKVALQHLNETLEIGRAHV